MLCFLQVTCSIFSALILSLAIPNEFLKFGSPLLGAFALVPLYYAFRISKSYRKAFWLCFIHGAVTHLLSSFWLGNFRGYAVFTLGASDIGTGFIEAFTGLVMFYPFAKTGKTESLNEDSGTNAWQEALKIFWFSGIYVLYEWCKSTGFLGYPWGTLSMTSFKWNFVTQIADITGPYGISFIFALISALTGEGIFIITHRKNSPGKEKIYSSFRQAAKCTFVILTVTLCYGIFQYLQPRTVVKEMNTVLVQQNIDTWFASEEESIGISKRLTEDKINEFKENGKKADLVVWSEGVLSGRFPAAQVRYGWFPEDEPLLKFIDRMDTPFIIGGSVVINSKKRQNGNASHLFDKDGNYMGSYSKMHLVPFAEAIPGVQIDFLREFVHKMFGSYGWTAGNKYVLFDIPLSEPAGNTANFEIFSAGQKKEENKENSVLVSSPICFDDAFGKVCRGLFQTGSEVFVNITNDSWSQTESAEYQHFVVASLRAIEYRTTLVRCANSGYTVVVAPNGKIIADLPLFTEDALAVTVPVYARTETFYAKFGNIFVYTIMILALIYILFKEKAFRVGSLLTFTIKIVNLNKNKRGLQL